MAHIKQNVFGLMKGKVGSISTYSNQTGNVARIRTNATNVGESASRSRKQQSNRVRWANLVNFYRASKAWMLKGFESKKKNRSDYNQFMSVNYALSKVALTKSEANAGACVVEGFMISQGSLTPIQVAKHDSHYVTNLKLGTLAITANTTVAELALALILNNNFIHEGMQLSFVSYQQLVDDLGLPRVICTPYEIILDSTNTEEKAYQYLPDFCLAASEGFLATGNDISVGGFAYVLSETISGRTAVSTQSLILNNETLIARYTSTEQIEEAIKSYGLTKNVFLDSDKANMTTATPQPLYIEKVVGASGGFFVAGDTRVDGSEFFGSDGSSGCTINMSAPVEPEEVLAANVKFDSGVRPESLVVDLIRDSAITVLFTGGEPYMSAKVEYLSVVIGGAIYKIAFTE